MIPAFPAPRSIARRRLGSPRGAGEPEPANPPLREDRRKCPDRKFRRPDRRSVDKCRPNWLQQVERDLSTLRLAARPRLLRPRGPAFLPSRDKLGVPNSQRGVRWDFFLARRDFFLPSRDLLSPGNSQLGVRRDFQRVRRDLLSPGQDLLSPGRDLFLPPRDLFLPPNSQLRVRRDLLSPADLPIRSSPGLIISWRHTFNPGNRPFLW